MREVSEASGHRVVELTNRGEALDLIHRDPPDVVFLDLQMPVLDGFCVVRQLRSDNRFRRLAVLGHRVVGIGASEALAPCESIRISLCLQRIAGRKMVFSSWRSTCISAESVPLKVSRPLVRRSNFLAGPRRKLRQLIRGGNHAGKIWVPCSHKPCEGSAFVFFIVALLVLAVSHQNPR
jgi:hypothetical protein